MSSPSIADTRQDQMFPTLDPSEIERVRRFGQRRTFAPGEALAKVGDRSGALSIVLSGEVEVAGHNISGRLTPIATHGPGAFLGELAQLAGRPALVDAKARGPVEALIIPPDQLRALLIAEAELGERIMRALILRRVGLLETGAGGPVIVGRADNGDVLRLRGFLRRNGHPSFSWIPKPTRRPRRWSSGFTSIPVNCRSCCARAASCCAIQARTSLRAASGLSARSTPTASTT